MGRDTRLDHDAPVKVVIQGYPLGYHSEQCNPRWVKAELPHAFRAPGCRCDSNVRHNGNLELVKAGRHG